MTGVQTCALPISNSAMANNAPNPQKQFWKGLWKLQVPNKVKVFDGELATEFCP